MPLLVLPENYGLVLLAASSTFFLNVAHSYRTVTLRTAAKVKYPNAYASDEQALKDPAAMRFNCAQRAHQNFTENLTPFLITLLMSGLRYPVISAVAGGLWGAGRVLYLLGYTSTGGPPARNQYKANLISTLCGLALGLMSVDTAVRYAMA